MSGIRLAGLELGGNGGEGGFSRAFLSPIDGSVTVYAGIGLAGGGGVVMELDLGSVSAFLGPLRIEAADEIALVDERGRFIAIPTRRTSAYSATRRPSAPAPTASAAWRTGGAAGSSGRPR